MTLHKLVRIASEPDWHAEADLQGDGDAQTLDFNAQRPALLVSLVSFGIRPGMLIPAMAASLAAGWLVADDCARAEKARKAQIPHKMSARPTR